MKESTYSSNAGDQTPRASFGDSNFPHIVYQHSASGRLVAVLSGTGIRVKTLVIAIDKWKLSATEIADQFNVPEVQVKEAQAFYEAHKEEIDADIESESTLELMGG